MEFIHIERRVSEPGLTRTPCKMIQQKSGNSGVGDVSVAVTVWLIARAAEDPYFSEAGGQH
jgi:hypothetical protein